MTDLRTFTVLGAYTHKVFATCVSFGEAIAWAKGYPEARGRLHEIGALGPFETWRTHVDVERGLRIVRVS